MKNVGFEVLDYGFIKLADTMGNDETIATNDGELIDDLKNLRSSLRMIAKNGLNSRLSGAECMLCISAPYAIIPQLIIELEGDVNYSFQDIDEFYVVKTEEHIGMAGKSSTAFDNSTESLRSVSEQCASLHEQLDMASSVRDFTKIATSYKLFYIKTSVRALMGFLSRKYALGVVYPYELRCYAEALEAVLDVWIPETLAAYHDEVFQAQTFNQQEMELVRQLFTEANESGRLGQLLGTIDNDKQNLLMIKVGL